MKPQEQIQKVSELMAVLDQKLQEAHALCDQAEKLGANVPCDVLNGNQTACEWWAFKCDQILKRLEKRDLIESALSKLTEAERKALKL